MSAHIQFTGTLLRDAEVRSRPAIDGLHAVPVVCMEIDPGLGGRTLRAEQPFTDATRRDAEALARRLVRGHSVTVTTPLQGRSHLVLHDVDHVVLAPAQPQATPAAPAQAPAQLSLE